MLPADQAAVAAVPPGSRARLARASGIAAAILLLGGAGGWAVAHWFRPPAEPQAIRLQLNPPPGGQFLFGLGITPGGMAIAPDGRTVAFVASVGGQAGLWIQSLDGAASRLLSGGDGAGYPFWSPDSKSLAFFANSKLQRVDLPGGAPLTICEVDASLRGSERWTHSPRHHGYGSVPNVRVRRNALPDANPGPLCTDAAGDSGRKSSVFRDDFRFTGGNICQLPATTRGTGSPGDYGEQRRVCGGAFRKALLALAAP